ncbi:hypothetical protein DMENIID0001_056790 [Sergentomyia squamirostris]
MLEIVGLRMVNFGADRKINTRECAIIFMCASHSSIFSTIPPPPPLTAYTTLLDNPSYKICYYCCVFGQNILAIIAFYPDPAQTAFHIYPPQGSLGRPGTFRPQYAEKKGDLNGR